MGTGEQQGEAGGGRPDPADVHELVDAIQKDARERSEAQTTKAPRRKRRPAWLYISLGLLAAANAYLWVGQPDWLTPGSSASPTESPLRFRMYAQAQRILMYERTHGSLPETLDETGAPLEGVEYHRTGPDQWELVGEADGVTLTLTSAMSPDEFLAR